MPRPRVVIDLTAVLAAIERGYCNRDISRAAGVSRGAITATLRREAPRFIPILEANGRKCRADRIRRPPVYPDSK